MKKNIELLPVAVGLFLLILVFGSSGRFDRPIYDGTKSQFTMTINDYSDRAEVGTIFHVSTTIKNQDSKSGSMFAQCSILNQNKAKYDFLKSVSESTIPLPEEDNCVQGEPFTQTVKVSLASKASEDYRFSFRVPDEVGGDNYLYCSIYERCGSEGDPYFSYNKKISIEVLPADDDDSNDNDASVSTSENYQCTLDRDCPGYIFGKVDCYKGFCVDEEDLPKEPAKNIISDIALKEWIRSHSIFITFIAIVLVIVGMLGFGYKDMM
jgi:hypothetical protein